MNQDLIPRISSFVKKYFALLIKAKVRIRKLKILLIINTNNLLILYVIIFMNHRREREGRLCITELHV